MARLIGLSDAERFGSITLHKPISMNLREYVTEVVEDADGLRGVGRSFNDTITEVVVEAMMTASEGKKRGAGVLI